MSDDMPTGEKLAKSAQPAVTALPEAEITSQIWPFCPTRAPSGASQLCFLAQRAIGHEEIVAASGGDELRQALQASAHGTVRNGELARSRIRARDWVGLDARSDKLPVVEPSRLHELELPLEIRSEENKHQLAIGAIVIENGAGSSGP